MTELSLAQYVIKEAQEADLDIAEVISQIRTTSLLDAEDEELHLQARLLQIRTLKLKLSKV